jgi:hypothetical protein
MAPCPRIMSSRSVSSTRQLIILAALLVSVVLNVSLGLFFGCSQVDITGEPGERVVASAGDVGNVRPAPSPPTPQQGVSPPPPPPHLGSQQRSNSMHRVTISDKCPVGPVWSVAESGPQKQFVFFHVFKAGGSSVRESLRRFADDHNLPSYLPWYVLVDFSLLVLVCRVGGWCNVGVSLRFLHALRDREELHPFCVWLPAPRRSMCVCVRSFKERILRNNSLVDGPRTPCATFELPKDDKHAVLGGHFSMGDANVPPCVMNWRDPVSRVVSAIGFLARQFPNTVLFSRKGQKLDFCCPGKLSNRDFAEYYLPCVFARRVCVDVGMFRLSCPSASLTPICLFH